MRLTHLGHACLLVETAQTRLVIDPGVFSSGVAGLAALDAILVTHQHPDHLDLERLPELLTASPDARLLAEPETAADSDTSAAATAMHPGDDTQVGDIRIRVVGGQHAPNHDQVPPIGNVGYLLTADGQTVFHPGDSYIETPTDIDVLALPLNAPWCRMSETLAFLHAVSPRLAIPIHTGLLSDDGLSSYLMHAQRFGPEGTEVIDLRPGSSYDV
ncbi:MAG: MBL fold metallo-hydrolase [Nocardioidaceae bacterium]